MMINPNCIIVALDNLTKTQVLNLVEQLDPQKCRLKVGKELFTSFGPNFVEHLQNKKFEIFLDLKFHDIPNTVAKACVAASNLGVWMTTLHTLGGLEMLSAAHEAILTCKHKPLLLGVTLLTSHDENTLKTIGLPGTIEENVLRLAALAHQAKLDGIVCSAKEAALIRKKEGKDFCLVTPGIRLENNEKHDQKRVATPKEAINAGANYLVIGRPITLSQNPQELIEQIYVNLKLT